MTVVVRRNRPLFPEWGNESSQLPPNQIPPADEIPKWLSGWIRHCVGAAKILLVEANAFPAEQADLIAELLAYSPDGRRPPPAVGVAKPEETLVAQGKGCLLPFVILVTSIGGAGAFFYLS